VPADLVALKGGRAILVECKSGRRARRVVEPVVVPSAAGGAPLLVVTPGNLRRSLEVALRLVEEGGGPGAPASAVAQAPQLAAGRALK
jgi:Holliday junction resolvase